MSLNMVNERVGCALIKKVACSFFLLILFMSLGCSQKAREVFEAKAPVPEINAETGEEPEQEVLAFSLSGHSENGEKEWEIQGRSASFINEEIVSLRDIVATAYGAEGEVKLTAEEGSFNQKTRDVHLEKNVKAKTSDGAHLETEYLNWSQKEEKIFTDAEVFIEKDNIKAQGRGAIAEPQLSKVELAEDIQVTIEPSTVVTCSGPLEVNYKENLAVFNKDVEVNDKRGKIFADRIEVYFNPETKEITKTIAEGNVRIMHGRNTVLGERAVYDTVSGKVVITGEKRRPKLILYSKEKE